MPRDSDGDGVVDTVDDCPTVKGPADSQGCPPKEFPALGDSCPSGDGAPPYRAGSNTRGDVCHRSSQTASG
ncbi:hypothetical protein [Actinacidiphila sp. ITFR-21]|uniref:hypothetical protein n=1 Tax=Actinacidiphila sp. ITFR-21 TaxID=3075199 RepID=UPI00288B330A|nr:hypothetical protein [Streptomyces sp. ITFR-21]WNI15289.1 hypothetical protein RLT57_06895 [Streptomyces sp. ITFR-21]